MAIPSPVAEMSPAAAPGVEPAERGARPRLSPLGRDLAAVLLVKFIVLALLWFAFFRTPAAPEMTMAPAAVAARVVGAPVPAEVPHGVP
ncbi:MAG: cytochrome oxidase putative small subunit CydP [Betaproteobacteria bacterium]